VEKACGYDVVLLQVCKVQMHSSGVSGVEGQPMSVISASRVIRSEVITVAAVQERFRSMDSPAKEAAAAAYKYRVQVQYVYRSETSSSRSDKFPMR
jgi:hypothetical protein